VPKIYTRPRPVSNLIKKTYSIDIYLSIFLSFWLFPDDFLHLGGDEVTFP